MIQIEYSEAKTHDDKMVHSLDGKDFSMYNNPSQLLKDVFPSCKIVFVTSFVTENRSHGFCFKVVDKFQNIYNGTMKGGKA